MKQAITTPRAILFDLDGTLLDSAPDLAGAVHTMQNKRGLPLTPYAQLRPQASKGARGLIGASFGLQPTDAGYEPLRREFLDTYEAAMTLHSRLFDGVTSLLQELQARGLAWGIVTNKLARFADVLVPQVGLGGTGCIVSGDTTAFAKPHPAPMEEAARRLGLPCQACWYVGDDQRDIAAGHAAHMISLAAGWGYCEGEDITQWGAHHVLQQPLDLLRLL